MKIEIQEISLRTKKLYLTRNRLIKHYLDCFILAGISLFFIFLITKGFVNKEGRYNSPYFLFFLIFPLLTVLTCFNKRKELRLTEINTAFSRIDNYQLVKDTLKKLNWQIRVDNKGFIEAYTNNFGFWTWTDQMISVLITDNKILFNSIGNVESYATQPFSWGQNSRNIKKFRHILSSNKF